MLTAELNEKLTRVGPGTPGGNLLRRYWQPVAASAELAHRPTKRVRILGEDLVLFKDRAGRLGLIEERCAHRRISLYYGIPEPEGLRCPYHGWLYDGKGNCLEQPAEPVESTFKDHIKLAAYPLEELGGLIFAYLGPAPVPLLPRYDQFVWDDAVRQIGAAVIPVNWVQAMENSLDATHVEWLHGYYGNYVQDLEAQARGEPVASRSLRHHTRIGFDLFEHGIVKRRVEEGGSEEDDDWRIGHAVIFPYILGNPTLQIRVPMDDTHTWHIWYTANRPGGPVPLQDPVPFFEMPWQTPDGEFITDFVDGQDIMAWVTQGPIADRSLERLGASDVGIILWRELLKEQIERVERGEDPIEVYRDPAANRIIKMPRERVHHGNARAARARQFAADGQRRVGRPSSKEYRALLQHLRDQAAAEGRELRPPEDPAILVTPLKRVTADLA